MTKISALILLALAGCAPGAWQATGDAARAFNQGMYQAQQAPPVYVPSPQPYYLPPAVNHETQTRCTSDRFGNVNCSTY